MVSWLAVFLAAIAFESNPLPGPAPRARLLYVREAGAEACPTAQQLRDAVAARLNYDPFDGAASRSLLARISRNEQGFVGSIDLVDTSGHPQGRRELFTAGEDCEEMAQAIALSISIAIAPERVLAAPVTTAPAAAPAPPKSPEAEPAVPRLETTSSSAPDPVQSANARTLSDREAPRIADAKRTNIQVSLAALTLVGVAPGVAFGGSLMAQGRRGTWSLGLGARVARSAGTDVQRGAELSTTFAAGELHGCYQQAHFEHCMGLQLGATRIRSSNVALPRTDIGAFGAGAWRSGVVAPISERFALLAQVEVALVFSPIHAQVDGQDVWRAPRVLGGLTAGARAHF